VTLDRYEDEPLDDADDTRDEAADAEPLTGEAAEEAEEIRAEIAQTRINMGGTLNELGDRLEPGNLVNQAKENVYDATVGRVEETAKGMSDMVIETIKRNPIPAAIAGAGLAMLWANRSNGTKDYRVSGYNQSGYRYVDGTDQGGQDLGAKARDAASTVGDAASTVGQNVTGAVGNVAEGAGQAVGEVGFRLDSFMKASPLAMTAIAAGAGAVIGAVLPETRQEQQVLGDVSRQIGTTVRDTVETATDKAEQTLDRTEEKVASNV
jgi:ElaB/YqjD/DUF883 family membrane-anchored ribosome-binding protein